MLGKLLRYEMVAVGRILGPVYGVLVALLLISIIPLAAGGGDQTFGLNVAVFLAFYAALIGTVVLLLQRFSKGLYGEEGYWARALPASEAMHVWAKTISAVIWCVLVIVALGAYLLISIKVQDSFLSTEGDPGILGGAMIQNPNLISDLLLAAVYLLVSLGTLILQVYAAISVGQLVRTKETLVAVLAFVGFMVVQNRFQSFLGLPGVPTGFGDLYTFGIDLAAFTKNLAGITILEVVFGVIFFLIAWAILKYRPTIQ